MSHQATTWVFEYSASTGNDRLVLLSIANHANREGTDAWPALQTISIEARCSTPTVKRSLGRLKKLDEVDWLSGAGFEGERRKSNFYWMPAMRRCLGLAPAPTTTAQPDPLSKSHKRSPRRHKGSKPRPQGLTAVSHELAVTVPSNVDDEKMDREEQAAKAREIINDLAVKKAIG